MRRGSVRASLRNRSSTALMQRTVRPPVQRHPVRTIDALDERAEVAAGSHQEQTATATSTTAAMMAMPRNLRCHSGGSMSDDTAKAANTPTPTTLMMPIAVRSSTDAAALTTGGTRPISSTTRNGSLATPRIVK